MICKEWAYGQGNIWDTTCTKYMYVYHIAGKFGRELNLVVLRSNLHFVTAKLKYFILAYTKFKHCISSKSGCGEILFKTPFGAATI